MTIQQSGRLMSNLVKLLNDEWGAEAKAIKPLSEGLHSKNWLVISKGEEHYILRELHGLRLREQTKVELDYLNYLNKSDFDYNVPKPISTRGKKAYAEKGNTTLWLYRYINGTAKEKLGAKEIGEIARLMISYHKIIRNYHSKYKIKKATADPFGRTELLAWSKYLQNIAKKNKSPLDKTYLHSIKPLLPILKKLDIPGYEDLETFSINADIKCENILWKGGSIVALLDFDNIGRIEHPLVKDLAVTIQYSFLTKRKNYINKQLSGYFISAYRKKLPLSKVEIRSIPFLIISHYINMLNYTYMLTKHGRIAKLNKLARTVEEQLIIYKNAAVWTYNNYESLVKCLDT